MSYGALTLGTFDGVHLGHQTLLRFMQQISPSNNQVFSFTTPPVQFFTKKTHPLLITLEHRRLLLSEYAHVHLLPFTQEIANQFFDEFLENIYEKTPFAHLVLGAGAAFGKGKLGTPDAVHAWGLKNQISVTYLPKTLYEGLPVSSGRIRECVLQGDLKTASVLLGRPYSIYAKVKQDGILELPSLGFCFPPESVYEVTCLGQSLHLHVTNNGAYVEEDFRSQEAHALFVFDEAFN